MKNAEYSRDEVSSIISAYNDLFPTISPELEEYWDYNNVRPWSCLTTNFQTVEYGSLQQLAAGVEQIKRERSSDLANLGNRLRGNASKLSVGKRRVGYSLGISPWTDDLLLRTHSKGRATKKVFIVVAHDWYPIVTSTYCARSPLQRDSVYCSKRYAEAAPRPEEIDATILFINLNPDFREPGACPIGKTDVSSFMRGLDALFDCLNPEFKVVGMFSWGAPVWRKLRARFQGPESEFSKVGLMDSRLGLQRSRPLGLIQLGCRVFPYWAFAHPSMQTYYSRHRSAVIDARSGLRLIANSAD